ncbi:MAG: xylulokinase [Planctomycetes bacterium]|nr:xylulokinase [Planctomycetota bacterium]
MTDLFLGLDVGTQGTKALLVDERAIVGRAASAYELLPDLPPGAAEQHPETWWSAVRACVRELGQSVDLARVRGIGVSGQQHGFVALDAARLVLRPAKLWCDTSTAAEARELTQMLGRAVPTGFTASKILWLKRHEPQHFARLAHVLLPHDWLNFRLSGELAMECGDASGTGLFDPAARAFDARACYAIDESLAAKLPRLVAPEEPMGRLTKAAASELGLPAGIPIAPGGGDNMCAAIGSGATRPGVATLSLGTSATVFAYARTPVLDPAGAIAPFCDSTGGYLPLLCVMNATGVLHEVARAFPGEDLESLTRAARDVAPGCDGLLFLPYLAGERVPDLPQASGTLLGIRPGSLTPARMFRAALEGVSLNLAWGVERLRALGLAIDSVRLVGGGAKNELWASMLADCLGARVQRLAESESAALGAALQAAWIVRRGSLDELAHRFVGFDGVPFEPDGARVAVYRDALARFRKSVERVHGA